MNLAIANLLAKATVREVQSQGNHMRSTLFLVQKEMVCFSQLVKKWSRLESRKKWYARNQS